MLKEAVWAAVAVGEAAGLAGEEAASAVSVWALGGSAFVRPAATRCRTAREFPALRKSVPNAGRR
jgi:hypothetical protein